MANCQSLLFKIKKIGLLIPIVTSLKLIAIVPISRNPKIVFLSVSQTIYLFVVEVQKLTQLSGKRYKTYSYFFLNPVNTFLFTFKNLIYYRHYSVCNFKNMFTENLSNMIFINENRMQFTDDTYAYAYDNIFNAFSICQSSKPYERLPKQRAKAELAFLECATQILSLEGNHYKPYPRICQVDKKDVKTTISDQVAEQQTKTTMRIS